jgi:hypothetical protein
LGGLLVGGADTHALLALSLEHERVRDPFDEGKQARSIMTIENHHIHYDADRGLIHLDDALIAALSYPDALKIELRANGIILTACESGGTGLPIVYEDEDIDGPHMVVDPMQAAEFGLRPGTYTAWVRSWAECIYALPAPVPAGLVPVTIHLTPHEVRLLEQLALDHDVRMTDILTAFAADLAAEHAEGDERHELRSGGSDERQFADAWFQRNRGPGGWGGDDGRPSFGRCYSGEETT